MTTLGKGLNTLKGKAGEFFRESPRFEKLKEIAGHYFTHPEQLNNMLSDVYNKATHEDKQVTVSDMWEKLNAFYRMFQAHVRGDYKELPTYKVVVLIAALVYLVSPYDLIPDKVPFWGAIDDIAVLMWFIKTINEEVAKFQEWESSKMLEAQHA
ncbi:DUF1232 domain-containing protein [Cytophagaceae bacterium ABcell3]|nr:DUF1232 domain-containing protein [Cytophagaceae bacterium ABcell3]